LNPNYDSYLQTATQLQRWRDFQAQVAAYLVVNTVFVLIWALDGRGFFWPVYPLVGWAFGLSFQHRPWRCGGRCDVLGVQELCRGYRDPGLAGSRSA